MGIRGVIIEKVRLILRRRYIWNRGRWVIDCLVVEYGSENKRKSYYSFEIRKLYKLCVVYRWKYCRKSMFYWVEIVLFLALLGYSGKLFIN